MSDNGLTSREAAALYLSDGKTDDPALASMLDYAKKQPELLIPKGLIGETKYKPAQLVIEDPDEVERKQLRDAIGFDYKVTIKDKKATVRDLETEKMTSCKLTDDYQVNAANLTKAVLRLKNLHDKYVNTIRPEYD